MPTAIITRKSCGIENTATADAKVYTKWKVRTRGKFEKEVAR